MDRRKARYTTATFAALRDRIAYLEVQLDELTRTCTCRRGGEHDSPAIYTDADHQTQQDDPPSDSGIQASQAATLVVERQNSPGASRSHHNIDWTGASHDLQLSETSVFHGFDLGGPSFELLWIGAQQQGAQLLPFLAITATDALLQVDLTIGETFYLGPTSNRHLVTQGEIDTSSARSYHPGTTGNDPQFTLAPDAVLLQEDHIFTQYYEQVNTTLPLFQKEALFEERASLPPVLFHAIMVIGAYFSYSEGPAVQEVDPSSLIRSHLGHFTARLASDMAKCSLTNVKAFLLRSYFAVLQGSLSAATIYLSRLFAGACEDNPY